VVPLPLPFLSFGLTVIATPLLGFEEATVRVYVSALAVNGMKTIAKSSTVTAIKTFFIVSLLLK
jgi:hypothetical protein